MKIEKYETVGEVTTTKTIEFDSTIKTDARFASMLLYQQDCYGTMTYDEFDGYMKNLNKNLYES